MFEKKLLRLVIIILNTYDSITAVSQHDAGVITKWKMKTDVDMDHNPGAAVLHMGMD